MHTNTAGAFRLAGMHSCQFLLPFLSVFTSRPTLHHDGYISDTPIPSGGEASEGGGGTSVSHVGDVGRLSA